MSRMFTTCPNCRMNLALTATDLRIGQGYVRCGRCEKVFNALIALTEDLEHEESGLVATGTTSVPALDQMSDALIPTEVEVVKAEGTGTFETIVLEGEDTTQTEEDVEKQQLDEELQQLAQRMDDDEFTRVRNALDADEPVSEDETETVWVDAEETEGEVEQATAHDVAAALGGPPKHHWGWRVAVALLVLLLAGQIVHHNRQQLVAVAWLEQPLKALYGALGERLEAKWDLQAYDLRQLGYKLYPGDTPRLVVRASIHNRALIAQPPPLIRASLRDRFGNVLASPAIAPQDYLLGEAPARMQPDQRLDLELILDDPKGQTDGFELDACLPGADGALHCSNEP
jgi:predicted Zn finger-like uncharacterized protein